MGKGHVKPKRGRPTVEMEFDGLPHENLAAAIVYQAVRDAQDLVDGKKPVGADKLFPLQMVRNTACMHQSHRRGDYRKDTSL